MAVARRVERRRAATREKLVSTALALFAEQGIYQTTIEDITDAADVGKGTFYQHFPSKTAIICHLLHDGFDDLLQECQRMLQSTSTSKERVEALLQTQFRFFEKRRDLLILFHQVRGFIKLQLGDVHVLRKEYERYVRFLASELAASLDGKRYSRATLMQMACVMAGLVTGYLSYLVILGLKKNGRTELETFTRIFFKGIGESETSG